MGCFTLLQRAVVVGNCPLVQMLLVRDANPNHMAPLTNAVQLDSLDIFKPLISHGANINDTNNFNKTALDIATRLELNKANKAVSYICSHAFDSLPLLPQKASLIKLKQTEPGHEILRTLITWRCNDVSNLLTMH